MQLIAGSGFGAQDFGQRTRTAIVNERFATFYFGSPDRAVGRTVNRDVTIVGVVTDAHFSTPRDEPARAMFVPFPPAGRPSMAHIVRYSGDRAAIMAALVDAVRAFDSRLRPRIATADDLLDTALARERFLAAVAWVLSALALTLACGGLYAAVAYAVSQRQAELAVRIALGASPRRVVLLVLRDPLMTTILGIAAGIPASWLLLRWSTALLFGVSPFDLSTVTICATAMILVALVAAARPAIRALGIDPVPSLRSS
jgi:predicted lysophospholipase L1 biosynthesis ABC-type transport system permease subunit